MGRSHYIAFSFLISMLLCLPGYGQEIGALYWLPEQIGSQTIQPAHINAHPFGDVSMGALGRYQIQSSHLRVATLFPEPGLIDEAQKNEIIGELGTDNQLHVGLGLPALVNFKVGAFPIGVSYAYRDAIFGQVPNAETIALVLRGNAPYAGQTVSDSDIALQRATWNQFGVSSGWQSEDNKLRFGLRLNLLLGSRLQDFSNVNYSLTTAPLGTEINLAAGYDQFTQFDQAQLGFSADLGLYYEVNEKLHLQLSAVDLGVINWQGYGRSVNTTFDYEGVEATNILSGEFGVGTDIVILDTLQEILFPDSTAQSQSWSTPGQIMIGGKYALTDKDEVFLNANWGVTTQSPVNANPRVQLGYIRSLGSMVKVGVQGYVGGMDRFGVGAFAQGDFILADKVAIRMFAQTQNALGWLAPETTRGFGASAGLTLSLLE